MKQDLKNIVTHFRSISKCMGLPIANCHAYEVLAAYYGYESFASLLADKDFSIKQNPNSIIKKRMITLEKFRLSRPNNVITLEYSMQNAVNDLLIRDEIAGNR